VIVTVTHPVKIVEGTVVAIEAAVTARLEVIVGGGIQTRRGGATTSAPAADAIATTAPLAVTEAGTAAHLGGERTANVDGAAPTGEVAAGHPPGTAEMQGAAGHPPGTAEMQGAAGRPPPAQPRCRAQQVTPPDTARRRVL